MGHFKYLTGHFNHTMFVVQGPALLWEQLGVCTAVWAATGLHGSGAEGLEGSQEAATQ